MLHPINCGFGQNSRNEAQIPKKRRTRRGLARSFGTIPPWDRQTRISHWEQGSVSVCPRGGRLGKALLRNACADGWDDFGEILDSFQDWWVLRVEFLHRQNKRVYRLFEVDRQDDGGKLKIECVNHECCVAIKIRSKTNDAALPSNARLLPPGKHVLHEVRRSRCRLFRWRRYPLPYYDASRRRRRQNEAHRVIRAPVKSIQRRVFVALRWAPWY